MHGEVYVAKGRFAWLRARRSRRVGLCILAAVALALSATPGDAQHGSLEAGGTSLFAGAGADGGHLRASPGAGVQGEDVTEPIAEGSAAGALGDALERDTGGAVVPPQLALSPSPASSPRAGAAAVSLHRSSPAGARTGAAAAPPPPLAGPAPTTTVEGQQVIVPSAASAAPIIGTNDGAGWGPEVASKILHGHITWDRIPIGTPPSVQTSLNDGFKVLAIAGIVPDGTPISQINPQTWGTGVVNELKANPGASLVEAGNEMYLKGGVANPVQYGRMYLAAANSMKAAGINLPLLFNMTGDYPSGTWSNPGSWSQDNSGGGWLRVAVANVPGLATAILANGISIHPYGGVGENVHDDWGIASAAADEAVAKAVLGAIPPMYVTEVGFDMARCGTGVGACSEKEQASKLKAAYTEMLADPHVAGIWWYESHDDSTGQWGFLNRNASSTTRPSFKALKKFGRAAGQ